jgi:enamine deaminase RidA (YjgF/YER057c/UK114 family)
MTITWINPDSMHASPYFSYGAVVEGGRILYIGGQNATDADGKIEGDIGRQAEQACRNVLAVIEAAGGSLDDLVKLTIIMVQGQDVQAAYQGGMKVLGGFTGLVTGMMVAGLGRPEALIEIEGIAHLPSEK